MQRDTGSELRPLQRLAWPGFVLDLGAGELLAADGRLSELRAQALKVLLVLGERAGQVVGKDELMRRV
jgi:DNA-binding winged helix-turn-helix (wHTH) protein